MKVLDYAGRAAAILLLVSTPGWTHHSGAMFDNDHKVTLTGQVRTFQWTNPHCYIQLVVRGSAGHEEEWSLEMGAPTYLQQLGWRPNTVKAGDTVTVTVSPLRNMRERKGGLVTAANDASGKPIGKALRVKP